MKYLLRNLLTLIFVPFSGILTASNDTICNYADDNAITLIFVGDVMQHSTQFKGALRDDGVYDFEPCFKYIKDEILSADLALANLEVPLAGKPYSGYPTFSGPDEIAMDLKKIGFDVLLTANNHSCDKGSKGVKRTVDILDSFGIVHTGMFRNRDERAEKYPLIVSVKNFRIAILNYTYSTNGMSANPLLINMIDSAQIIEDIEKAKLSASDIIIAFMHWGNEYERRPGDEQKKLTEMLFLNGVNLVIGAHPHVIQPMEKRYSVDGRCDKLVAYSLGNFVSNQPFPNTDGGAILKVSIVKDGPNPKITWAGYNLVWVYKPRENGKTRHYILPVADYENDAEKLDASFLKEIGFFAKNARTLLNKENTGIGEYRILPQRRKIERLQQIETSPVKVVQMK
ncbi:MAG: CapA family protein [Prevotellaceae bacterium]|jgi:poly-gamma-glutamate synthesis protein (capsule biosynthesis protein)|nr:CapA family protein [Prevotellaceae bacterium]